MKKVKMAVLAFAAISSIGSAFAFSPAAKTNAVTYYALKTGTGTFAWTTNNPGSRTVGCKTTAMSAICTITTSNVPQANLVPAGHTANGTVYR